VSEANVEIVRRMIDAYNAGDLDAMVSFYTPNVVAVPDASLFPEAGVLHGREEWRGFLKETAMAWVTPQYGTSDLFALDDGRVVHRGDWGGEGVASGIELASGITGIYTIRDGQISKVMFFFDHADALKAVGLAE
jgi:ketosteroid isomerase-like protein